VDYKAIWNDICHYVNKNREVNEKEFQTVVELLFAMLGWSVSRGEILSQITIPDGAAKNIKPDIIIAENGKNVFVVEIKKANADPNIRNEFQLFSYMNRLRLDFGVLLSKSMQVYYKRPSKNEPERVCKIQFDDNSETGIECIAELSKKDFSLDHLKDFCERCLSDPEKYVFKSKKVTVNHNQSTASTNVNLTKYKKKLTHAIMEGPKVKSAYELRHNKKKIVCWEMTYREFFDYLRNPENAHPRMPAHVKNYISGMTEDQYEYFTENQSIVFYYNNFDSANKARIPTSITIDGFEDKHRPKRLLSAIPSEFSRTGEVRGTIYWNGFTAQDDIWKMESSTERFVIKGKHKFQIFIVIGEYSDGRLMLDRYYLYGLSSSNYIK